MKLLSNGREPQHPQAYSWPNTTFLQFPRVLERSYRHPLPYPTGGIPGAGSTWQRGVGSQGFRRSPPRLSPDLPVAMKRKRLAPGCPFLSPRSPAAPAAPVLQRSPRDSQGVMSRQCSVEAEAAFLRITSRSSLGRKSDNTNSRPLPGCAVLTVIVFSATEDTQQCDRRPLDRRHGAKCAPEEVGGNADPYCPFTSGSGSAAGAHGAGGDHACAAGGGSLRPNRFSPFGGQGGRDRQAEVRGDE